MPEQGDFVGGLLFVCAVGLSLSFGMHRRKQAATNTRTGQIAMEEGGLRVNVSWLASISSSSSSSAPHTDSFLGLFAERPFAQGQVVCVYRGIACRTVEALRLRDKSYLMRLGEQCYVDARETPHVLARYINDCINPAGWNVKFDKQASEQCAYVVALRNIATGEELFADYGKRYWRGASIVPARISFAQLQEKKNEIAFYDTTTS